MSYKKMVSQKKPTKSNRGKSKKQSFLLNKKQVWILLSSLVVFILAIGILYPFVAERGVVGKAGAGAEGLSGTFVVDWDECAGSSFHIPKLGKFSWQYLCVPKVPGKAYLCDANSFGSYYLGNPSANNSPGEVIFQCDFISGKYVWRYNKIGEDNKPKSGLIGSYSEDGQKNQFACDELTNKGELIDNKYFCDGFAWKECSESTKGQLSFPGYNYICKSGIPKDADPSKKADYFWLPISSDEPTPPAGWHWETTPIKSETAPSGVVELIETSISYNSNLMYSGYCPYYWKDFACVMSSYDGSEQNYCYAEGTTIKTGSGIHLICDHSKESGSMWTSCEESLQGYMPIENGNTICYNNEWQVCDEEKTLGEDEFFCYYGSWSSEFKLTSYDQFSVKLLKGNNPITISTFNKQDGMMDTPFSEISLCDESTENSADKATICYNENQKVILDSNALVLDKQANPYIKSNLMFLYPKDTEQKYVDVIDIYQIWDETIDADYFPYSAFSKNFVDGRKIALRIFIDSPNLVVDEYYILASKNPGTPFDHNDLYLTHVPSLETFEIESLPKGEFVFKVFDGQNIFIKEKNVFPGGNEYVTLTLGEAPTAVAAAYALPVPLSTEYEANFTDDKIIDITNYGVVGGCKGQLTGLTETFPICDNVGEKFSLQNRDVKVETKNHKEFVFWYQAPVDEQPKTGFAFEALDLTSDESVSPNANQFQINLRQGKRLALLAHDKVFLLTHPKQKYLDLTQIGLMDLSTEGQPVYLPEGDQERITFSLPLGKQITLSLNVDPSVSFDIVAKEAEEKVVDLVKEFQTKMSTYSTVRITNPQLKNPPVDLIFSLGENDNTLEQTTMEIRMYNRLNDVALNKPIIFEDEILVNYNQFSSGGLKGLQKLFTKYANIHLYTNLTNNLFETSYTDESFIIPIIKENKIAFSLEGNYYLLAYSIPWKEWAESIEGFDAGKLILTNLEGEKVADGIKLGVGHYSFDFETHRVEYTIDGNANKIKFEGFTGEELEVEVEEADKVSKTADFIPAEEYKFVLQEDQFVDVAGDKYEICDKLSYKTFSSKMQFCAGDTLQELKELEYYTIDGMLVYFTAEVIGGEVVKEVVMQHFEPLTEKIIIPEWTELIENFQNERYPAFSWNGNWFEFKGQDAQFYQLANIEVAPLSAPGFCDVNVFSEVEGYHWGVFSCEIGDWKNAELQKQDPSLAIMVQELNKATGEISLELAPLDTKVISGEQLNVTGTLLFTPSIELYSEYNLYVTKLNDNLLKVEIYKQVIPEDVYAKSTKEGQELYDMYGERILSFISLFENLATSELFFSTYLPFETSQEVLLPNGEIVIMEVVNLENPTVSITKPIVASQETTTTTVDLTNPFTE